MEYSPAIGFSEAEKLLPSDVNYSQKPEPYSQDGEPMVIEGKLKSLDRDGTIDRASLLRETTKNAITNMADPIKITWYDMNYTVQVPANE